MNDLKSHFLIFWCILGGACVQMHAAAPLSFDQVTTGAISSAAQSTTHTFSASAADVISFALSVTSGTLQPVIELYDPTGTDIAFNYNGNPYGCSAGSTLEMNNVKIPSTGTYTVLIKDCGDTNTGNYSIFMQRMNNPVGGMPLVFGGQPQSGTLASPISRNSYNLSASAGDVISFTLSVTGGALQPVIELYDSTGTNLTYNYNGNPYGCSAGSTLEMDNVKLPATGYYTVFIKDCSDTNTGNYSIFMQRMNNPAGVVPLGFGGQPQSGMITSPISSNSFAFSGSSHDVINFTLVVTNGKLEPVIELYDSTGTDIAYNYNGNPYGCSAGSALEMNNVKLPSTGYYTVFVKDCSDTNTGSYSLSAQCFGVCTGPSAPPSTCNFAVAPASQVFPSGTSSGEIGVLTTSGCPWTATTSASFLSITSGASGTGSGVVLFSATANGNAASRTGTLSVAGQSATVTQSGTSPYLLLTPSSVSVTWTQGSPLPAPIPVSIYTATSSLPYKTTVSALGNWLSVTPASGNAPGTMLVSVNPQSLTAGGPYMGTVMVSSNEATPPSQTFTVTLNISLAGSPALSVNTNSLNYSFPQGAQQIQQQRILVGNSGEGTLTYPASAATNSGANWLSVAQDGAGATLTTPDPLTITVNPLGLAVGTYTGSIAIAANATSTGNSVTIPVTVTVGSVQQTILLSQTGLTFTAVQIGGAVPSQTFGVLNSGAGVMNWSVSSSITDTGNWLSVTPTSGSTDASSLTVPLVTVTVNPATLPPGQYSGQIQVTSTGANNTPQYVSVILNVLPAGSNPGPVVLPSGLIFTQAAGGSAAASQTVSVSNLTGTQLTFNTGTLTSDGSNWFTVTPTAGTVMPAQPTALTVNVSSIGLTPAIRQGVLTILFQDGSVRTVNVLYLLATGATTSARTGPAHAVPESTAATCTPTKLLPLLTSLGAQFTVPAAWPNTLQAQVVDDCGNPHLSGTVVASFSNGDPPVPLISLKNGTWTGTWQITNSSVSVMAVTVNADDPTLKVSGSVTVSGSLQNSVNAPVIAAGGVLNAASYSLSAPLSPGSMISIFGSNLANGTTPVNTFPLPTQLSGTLVTIGGQPAPLLYAGSGQLNAIVPFGLPVNTNAQVIVRQGNAYTAPLAITLAPANPAIFTAAGSGTGQGIIIRPDGNIAQPGTPAQGGDELLIYAAGLGATNPEGPVNQAASASPLEYTVGTATLTIGGQPARVDFAGLAPGFAGLYQINAAVPAGVHGDTLPVVLSVGGQPGPPVTMAVQ